MSISFSSYLTSITAAVSSGSRTAIDSLYNGVASVASAAGKILGFYTQASEEAPTSVAIPVPTAVSAPLPGQIQKERLRAKRADLAAKMVQVQQRFAENKACSEEVLRLKQLMRLLGRSDKPAEEKAVLKEKLEAKIQASEVALQASKILLDQTSRELTELTRSMGAA